MELGGENGNGGSSNTRQQLPSGITSVLEVCQGSVLSSQCSLWRKLTQQVAVTKPMSDLCQKNSTLIMWAHNGLTVDHPGVVFHKKKAAEIVVLSVATMDKPLF